MRQQIVLILDSGFLIAFHNRNDVHHAAALRVMEDLLGREDERVLLLEYVFLEVVTVLLARRGLPAAIAVAGILLEAREVEFVPCSEFFPETLVPFVPRKRRLSVLPTPPSSRLPVARKKVKSPLLIRNFGEWKEYLRFHKKVFVSAFFCPFTPDAALFPAYPF